MNLTLHTVLKPLLAGTLLTLVPLAAHGRPGEPGPRHDRGPGFDLPGLTDAQKASLKTIADKHQAALEAARKSEGAAQETLQKALRDPATQDADLKALFDKTSQARFAALLEHRAMMQESLAVLTDEQRADFAKHRAEGGPRHGGRGPGGPEGPDHGDALRP